MTQTRNQMNGAEDESSGPIIELTERIKPQDLEQGPIIELTAPIQSQAEITPPGIEPYTEERHDFPDTAFVLDEEIGEDIEADYFVDSLGIEIPAVQEPETRPEAEEVITEADAIAATDAAPVLTAERIEATLERVVEKVYTEKIEGVLVEVIERVVAREIERLRSLLSGESDSDA